MFDFADAVLLKQALAAADEGGSPAAEQQKLQILKQVLSNLPEMHRYNRAPCFILSWVCQPAFYMSCSQQSCCQTAIADVNWPADM